MASLHLHPRANTGTGCMGQSGNRYFTKTLHRMHSMNQWCGSTIELVNVRHHCDNHRALAHAIPALNWAKWCLTGNAAARAFAFQDDGFCQRRGWSRGGSPRRASGVGNPCRWSGSIPDADTSSSSPKRTIDASTRPNVVGALQESDAPYSQAQRANFQAVSQEQSCKVIVGLALRNRGALEIMKPDAMRAVVQHGWPNGGTSPHGPVL